MSSFMTYLLREENPRTHAKRLLLGFLTMLTVVTGGVAAVIIPDIILATGVILLACYVIGVPVEGLLSER